jgi:hypothetical protein
VRDIFIGFMCLSNPASAWSAWLICLSVATLMMIRLPNSKLTSSSNIHWLGSAKAAAIHPSSVSSNGTKLYRNISSTGTILKDVNGHSEFMEIDVIATIPTSQFLRSGYAPEVRWTSSSFTRVDSA